MDLLQFLGRFHVLIVHFPIALLMVAAVYHWMNRKGRYEAYRGGVNKLLLIGASSAILSCILGLMLVGNGGYDESAVNSHKWMGIGLAVVSSLAWVLSKRDFGLVQLRREQVNRGLMAGVILLTILTGHYGGNLTHGSEYLFDEAPQFVRSIAGFAPKAEPRPAVTNLDSAHVYLDLVEPILRRRCVSCHSESKTKGGLRMTSHAELLTGGDSGPAVVAASLGESELFRRITLSPEEEEFMPPDGKTPLTDDQVAIIEWWIEQGAPEEGQMASLEVGEEVLPAMQRYFGLGAAAKNAFPLPEIAPADPSVIASLTESGFIVNTLSEENNYLDVDFSTSGQEITAERLQALVEAKDHITWLNLAGASATDEHMKLIGQLTNLTKLNLSRNGEITEEGTTHLGNLEELEYLNLYATGVSDVTLDHIQGLPRLRSVFLWQSNVSPEKAAELRAARPGMTVDTGEKEA